METFTATRLTHNTVNSCHDATHLTRFSAASFSVFKMAMLHRDDTLPFIGHHAIPVYPAATNTYQFYRILLYASPERRAGCYPLKRRKAAYDRRRERLSSASVRNWLVLYETSL